MWEVSTQLGLVITQEHVHLLHCCPCHLILSQCSKRHEGLAASQVGHSCTLSLTSPRYLTGLPRTHKMCLCPALEQLNMLALHAMQQLKGVCRHNDQYRCNLRTGGLTYLTALKPERGLLSNALRTVSAKSQLDNMKQALTEALHNAHSLMLLNQCRVAKS